jgi:hypothetical protein
MGNPIETYAASLNEEERALLHSSVAFVLRVVVKADSVVDRKEESAVAAASTLARERLGEAFIGTPDRFPDATKAADHPDWPQSAYIRNLAGVVRRMPADARKIFDAAILEMALTVAGASGGILGFGEKFSVEEKYGIRRLVAGLDLQIEDAGLKKRLGYDA